MPVLVTSAETGTGRAVVRLLLRTGGEVRAYLEPGDGQEPLVDAYRRYGVKVARGALADEGWLEAAMEQAHTVVHTGGGPLDEPDVVVDEVASVTSAALGAGCRRVVWASYLQADDPGTDAYLTACSEAEALLAEAPLESVVIRRALTYGPHDRLTRVLATGAADPRPDARHAPLFVGDLAAALVAADADRGPTGARHVVVELAGPEVVELSRLVTELAPSAESPVSWEVRVPAHLRRLLSRDQPPGRATLGRTGTPLDEGLARTLSPPPEA